MRYILFICLHICLVTLSYAQDNEMRLVSSKYSTIIDQKGFSSINPVYAHKGSTLAADSGIVYKDDIGREFFEAFGNVVITQPSGTTIYANQLHYNALSQEARLTGNVKMIDGGSTLTTNYLTYNMRSKIGTYTGGGRIISKGDTITSKNAYYFENTQDSYFRHKVVVRNAQVKVYTDTMRYNSTTQMTYFFGPTNIKGNAGENLYTEKGNYNTASGIANFNKNNLYTEGTRFLKGDSLHYNRDNGIGEAFRNVVYVDTLDKFYAYGDKGLYKQEDESILLTEKPLIIIAVKNDSTDSASKDSTQIEMDNGKKTVKSVKNEEKELAKQSAQPVFEKPDAQTDSIAMEKPLYLQPDTLSHEAKVDSAYLTADTIFSKMILLKEYKPLLLNLSRNGGQLEADEEPDYGDDNIDNPEAEMTDEDDDQNVEEPASTSEESTIEFAAADSTATINTTKETPPPTPIKKDSVSSKAAVKAPVARSKQTNIPSNTIESTLKADSLLRQRAEIPVLGQADSIMNKALKTAKTPDSIKASVPTDSTLKSDIADTAKTRIVRAHYNVRLFKSDLQAVADSTYYGMADSMFRFMGKPMIWTQGSQISGDTIYMQMVNQQVDNALLKGNAFMINTVLDTVKFNQLKGRKITAFFKNNDIDLLFVDGNAENLIFTPDEKTNLITEMFHDRGARIRVKMENRKLIDYLTIRKVDQKVYPFKMVNQDNEILPGFIWRPQDRPTSKEDLLNRKRSVGDVGAVGVIESIASPDKESSTTKTAETAPADKGSAEHTDNRPLKKEVPQKAPEKPQTPIETKRRQAPTQ